MHLLTELFHLQQLEPSVRISVSLPWDAAQRLRQLAVEGNSTLRALGILSVQPEGDSVIALNVGGQDIKITKGTYYPIMFRYKRSILFNTFVEL